MPRIMIADDRESMRSALRSLLELRPDWVVCGEAENAKEAISKATALGSPITYEFLDLRPLHALRSISRFVDRKPRQHQGTFAARTYLECTTELPNSLAHAPYSYAGLVKALFFRRYTSAVIFDLHTHIVFTT